MNRAIFLDRDGVINKKAPDGDYVVRWEDFRFLDGIVEAISEINKAGIRVIVVTNQRCVAKGLITAADLESLHRRMFEFLAERGAVIDGIYFCPHEVDLHCRCRKPAPGMLLNAANDHDLQLMNSWMVGDSQADIEAGKRAGCRTALLLADGAEMDRNQDTYGADLMANSLLDLVRCILGLQKPDGALEASSTTEAAHSPMGTATPANR
ncbi:MAG TPA: HAD family hydrolase [Terriglobia bacterium]|nr:HAD family hydrolase [Terriglobia bacterium]